MTLPVTAPSVPSVPLLPWPARNAPEGRLPGAENRCPRMVLETHDLTEVGVEDDPADHPGGVAARRDVEDAEARQLLALDGDERVADELVHPADHDHRCPVRGQAAQPVANGREVVLDPALPGVLAPAAHEQVRRLGSVAPGSWLCTRTS